MFYYTSHPSTDTMGKVEYMVQTLPVVDRLANMNHSDTSRLSSFCTYLWLSRNRPLSSHFHTLWQLLTWYAFHKGARTNPLRLTEYVVSPIPQNPAVYVSPELGPHPLERFICRPDSSGPQPGGMYLAAYNVLSLSVIETFHCR